MYKFQYDETLLDESSRQKTSEREAIEYSIELLRLAQVAGRRSHASAEALAFVNRLWGFFIDDLANSDNALPPPLRAKIISIGIWLIREADAISDERSDNFKGLIEISETIAEGLK